MIRFIFVGVVSITEMGSLPIIRTGKGRRFFFFFFFFFFWEGGGLLRDFKGETGGLVVTNNV